VLAPAGETASLDAFCNFFAGVKLTKGTQVGDTWELGISAVEIFG
jgi:hypothetical protein